MKGQASDHGDEDDGNGMDPDEELFLAFRLEEEEQINKAILESLREAPQGGSPMRQPQSADSRPSSSLPSEHLSREASRQGLDTDAKVGFTF